MPIKTVGARASLFLETVAAENRPLVTPAEAGRICGYSPHRAAVFLGQLARRHLLTRLRRGLYAVVPFGKAQEFGNLFLVAHALAGDAPHSISHLGAMAFHNMLVQPSRTVHISMPGVRHIHTIGGMRFVFVPVPPKKIWGWKNEWVTDTHRVPVADVERTLIDGCARPDLCGGIIEVARAMWLTKDRLDSERLLTFIKRYGKFAVAKRLGFIMDTLDAGSQGIRRKIQQYAARSRPYVVMDPMLPAKGRLNSRWRLRLNVSADEIRSAVRT